MMYSLLPDYCSPGKQVCQEKNVSAVYKAVLACFQRVRSAFAHVREFCPQGKRQAELLRYHIKLVKSDEKSVIMVHGTKIRFCF